MSDITPRNINNLNNNVNNNIKNIPYNIDINKMDGVPSTCPSTTDLNNMENVWALGLVFL